MLFNMLFFSDNSSEIINVLIMHIILLSIHIVNNTYKILLDWLIQFMYVFQRNSLVLLFLSGPILILAFENCFKILWKSTHLCMIWYDVEQWILSIHIECGCSDWWIINNLPLASEAFNIFFIYYINKILFSLPW